MGKTNRRNILGDFEEAILVSILREPDGAYGVPIRREVEQILGGTVSVGAISVTLDRLESKGYVKSWTVEGEGHRGRPRKYYRVEGAGLVALEEALAEHRRAGKVVASVLGQAGAL